MTNLTFDSGTIAAIVAVLGFGLTSFGITVDPSILTGLVGGIIAVVTALSAIWSAYQHTQKVATA